MKFETTFGGSMALVSFIFLKLLPWILVLVIVLSFAGFIGIGLIPIILTSLVLLLSTLFLAFTKHKSWPVEEQVSKTGSHMEPNFQKSVLRKQDQQEKEEEHDVSQVGDNFLVKSPDSMSESECINPSYSSDESEVDWPFRDDNVEPSPDCSDGSISDEDSLIEIAIPSGHYVGHKIKDDYKYFMQQKKQPADFSPNFQESNLMDLFGEINDMNEEDNLIEIDILMGSIKCSRFGIEA